MNSTSKRYPVEARERAVRIAFEREDEYDSQWTANSTQCQSTRFMGICRGLTGRRKEEHDGLPGSDTQLFERSDDAAA
jgi:hypothetical protein